MAWLGLMVCLTGCGKHDGAAPQATVPPATSALQGYTLVQQMRSHSTDLIGMDGQVVHSWRSNYSLAGGSYLLPDGDLLRSGLIVNSPFNNSCPGLTGVVERFDWDGQLQWSYTFADASKSLHHDIFPMPNGNLLMLGVEVISKEQQIAMGRDPARATKDLWLDFVMEVKPTGRNGGKVLWEWHLVDHLVQEFDNTKSNYAVVSDHPELVDVNFIENHVTSSASSMRNLQAIGYVGQAPREGSVLPDWSHLNSVCYQPHLDQVLLSAVQWIFRKFGAA